MKKAKNYWLFVLAVIPAVSMAQTYKCKKADGSVSFQDYQCQTSANQARVMFAPVRTFEKASEPENVTMRKSAGTRQIVVEVKQDPESQRYNEAVRAHNQQADAYNKSLRCNQARQQLGVAKESYPVFTRGNDGSRQYVDDKDRAALTSRQEQRVAAACQ